MHSLPILSELPPGYFVEESPRGILALDIDAAPALHRAGFGPEHDGSLRESDLVGRRPLKELAVGDERFVVRRYSHGGLLRWITGSRFLDPGRPFRELILAHALRRGGLRTAPVAAARARMVRAGGWHLDLITRRVEDSLDLGRVLEAVRRGEVERRALGRILPAVGIMVRQLHRHGVLHGDLTPRNVLVSQRTLGGADEPELWIIDLDGSVWNQVLGKGERRANLRRLYRHTVRASLGKTSLLRRTDCLRFLKSYDQGEGNWKADWRAIARAHGLRSVFHAMGWVLERLFGRLSTLPEERPRGREASAR